MRNEDLDQIMRVWSGVSDLPWERDGMTVYSKNTERMVCTARRSDEPEAVKLANTVAIVTAPLQVAALVNEVKKLNAKCIEQSDELYRIVNLSKRMEADYLQFKRELERLASYILENWTDEPGKNGDSESAVDVSIRLLRQAKNYL